VTITAVKLNRDAGLGAALVIGCLVIGCLANPAYAAIAIADGARARPDTPLVERGRYLAVAGDCVSCHTRPNGLPFSGGRALNTPFGVIYSANITPDAGTGIGNWSEAQFARALREGIGADGKHLYPAFPYTAYTKLTDSDVSALYAYVRSLRPVRYTPPQNAMPFPFGIRSLMAAWNMMFFDEGRFVPDTTRSAEWNRGAYLIQGLGHCGSCHTPRNALGGESTASALTGGAYLDDIADEVVEEKVTPMDERTVRSWSSPNLTPARNGLGAWSSEQIVAYLKTGHNERAGAFGPMIEVIANGTSRLSDPDLRAIAFYLKSLAPQTKVESADRFDARLKAGAAVYTARCGDCHQPTGLGTPVAHGSASKSAPPLAGNAVLQAPNPATLINVILYGAHGGGLAAESNGTWPWPKMSGFELSVGLDDEQIAALCTYVRSSWGNQAGSVSAADVAQQH
jgi:mono/diheme cytochrome c family protein